MAIDSTIPRTRRAILTGALGAAAAVAIDAVKRPAPAEAATAFVVLGGPNTATDETSITNTSGGLTAFSAHASGSIQGVAGSSASGTGVSGSSNSGHGVEGYSPLATGVYGSSAATDHPGTVGWSRGDETGVFGYSNNGSGSFPAIPAKTGVYGYANQDADARGVKGKSPQGVGVEGDSTSYIGVIGGSSTWLGVYGQSDTATGVSGGSSSGVGVMGYTHATDQAAIVGHSDDGSTGVLGFSGSGLVPAALAKTGVCGFAQEVGGRGGQFHGAAAQVRLLPSKATSHPSSGQRGDLFVDTSGRLWFCRGGTTWKQIA